MDLSQAAELYSWEVYGNYSIQVQMKNCLTSEGVDCVCGGTASVGIQAGSGRTGPRRSASEEVGEVGEGGQTCRLLTKGAVVGLRGDKGEDEAAIAGVPCNQQGRVVAEGHR